MSNFFLLNAAIDIEDLDVFKNGMSELVGIEKVEDHIFLKHNSVYNLKVFNELFSTYGPIETAIIIFLEQQKLCDEIIDTEEKATLYDSSKPFAFLGVNFNRENIKLERQIIDDPTYKEFCFISSTNLERLKQELGDCILSKQFKKDFLQFKDLTQLAIIDDFVKAKNRGLKTPFSPDTKIISDVTNNKSHTVNIYELRVYTPIALRVYFNETNGVVKLASIEQKSNPNQSNDINSAHRIIKEL